MWKFIRLFITPVKALKMGNRTNQSPLQLTLKFFLHCVCKKCSEPLLRSGMHSLFTLHTTEAFPLYFYYLFYAPGISSTTRWNVNCVCLDPCWLLGQPKRNSPCDVTAGKFLTYLGAAIFVYGGISLYSGFTVDKCGKHKKTIPFR